MEFEPRIVQLDEFRYAGRHHTGTDSVITRAWKSTLALESFMTREPGIKQSYYWYKNEYPDVVNFDSVMQGVRYLETGKHHYMLLGRIAWNTIAEINNSSITINNPKYMIDWTPHIHNNFRNGPATRERAANLLATAYQDLGKLVLERA